MIHQPTHRSLTQPIISVRDKLLLDALLCTCAVHSEFGVLSQALTRSEWQPTVLTRVRHEVERVLLVQHCQAANLWVTGGGV